MKLFCFATWAMAIKLRPLFIGLAVLAGVRHAAAQITTNVVPGTANPWLAGMPDGSVAGDGYDTAPAESPVQVTGMSLGSGALFNFSATGSVYSNGGGANGPGPDGEAGHVLSRTPGAENGIGDIAAPINSLLGVFLDDSIPSNFAPPVALSFSSAASRDFSILTPELRQPFFIGDGQTSTGNIQQFVAPQGATRLFLGTMLPFTG